jgi:hypothetical protein
MATKRSPKAEAAGRRLRESGPGAPPDLLGKALATYSSVRSGVLLVIAAVILGLGGGAVLGAAGRLAYDLADSRDDRPYTYVGWGMTLTGTLVMAAGVLQFGRRLEVRQKGVRFRRRQRVQELRWDEVYDIIVRKTVTRDRNGVIRVNWDVEIYAYDDAIYLRPAFLRRISSVSELINMLKVASGKDVVMEDGY